MRGRVTKSTGAINLVRDENSEIYSCTVKGNFRVKGIRSTNPVAVGDWVEFQEKAYIKSKTTYTF